MTGILERVAPGVPNGMPLGDPLEFEADAEAGTANETPAARTSSLGQQGLGEIGQMNPPPHVAPPQEAAAPPATPAPKTAATKPHTSRLKQAFNFAFGVPFLKVPQATAALTLIYYGDRYGPFYVKTIWGFVEHDLLRRADHHLGDRFTKTVDANYPMLKTDGTPAYPGGIRAWIRAGAAVPDGVLPEGLIVSITRKGEVSVTDASGKPLPSYVKHGKVYVLAQTANGEAKHVAIMRLGRDGQLLAETDPRNVTKAGIPVSADKLREAGVPLKLAAAHVPAAAAAPAAPVAPAAPPTLQDNTPVAKPPAGPAASVPQIGTPETVPPAAPVAPAAQDSTRVAPTPAAAAPSAVQTGSPETAAQAAAATAPARDAQPAAGSVREAFVRWLASDGLEAVAMRSNDKDKQFGISLDRDGSGTLNSRSGHSIAVTVDAEGVIRDRHNVALAALVLRTDQHFELAPLSAAYQTMR